MVNQAFRIKIAYWSKEKKEKEKKEEKIPGIRQYPMGPTKYHGSYEQCGRLLAAESKPQQADRSFHRNLWKSAFYYQTGCNRKYSTLYLSERL